MTRGVNWFVFFHILAALWLAAGAFGGAVVRAQGRRAESTAERLFAWRLGWRLLTLFTLPGAVVAGLLGIHLVSARGFSFREGWVHLSLLLWALALLSSLFVLLPRLKKTLRAAGESLRAGAPSDELQRLTSARWPGYLADFNALAVVLLTLLMVFKPFAG